ncbi:HopJ type III effector protein [Moraxella cuniculi DSM 21768]|uniref:HopJ type III effector protein n=1 Tax=Moraxella cuniculi DSM 21768 TaxID=1122245 RepID=A0A1N7DFX0_9GAMM|nr:HopJ type III effector protein [Moraxella cuniculi]OOS08033.1 HopJ type III effector protein [Moraxella cuniculi]SIR74712.1 HopJ type III effector protein [Moraxella cuniculi DSM 21768]
MQMTDISRILAGVADQRLNFADVITFIETNYHYTPISFSNGELNNAAGTNEGSAKVFSLAKLHGLNQLDTLSLFAEHYRAVLANPEGSDHANIRNFLHYGWQGIGMPKNALTPKA